MKSSKQNSAKVVPAPSTVQAPAPAPTTGSGNNSLPDAITPQLLSPLQPLAGASTVYGQIWRFDSNTVLKRCGPSRTAEAAALRFVAQHTSIPVPKVLKTIDSEGYLFMEYLDGQPLDTAWDSLTAAQKKGIASQLKGYMAQLREVSGTFVGSVDRSICNDQIFSSGTYGPFVDEDAFREGIATALRSYVENDGQDPAWVEQVVDFVNAIPRNRKIVLTHGDFVPRNILVSKDGDRVVGIVDWEMAGFYPEYWEYCKAHFFADYESEWIKERVPDRILEKYSMELGLLVHARRVYEGF